MPERMRKLIHGLVLLATLVLLMRAAAPRPALGPAEPRPRCLEPVEVPGKGVLCAGEGRASGEADRRAAEAMAPERLQVLEVALDLNRASAAALTSLPGLGPRLAERIVAARPFASVAEVVRVRGIGPKRLRRWRPRLYVSTPHAAGSQIAEESERIGAKPQNSER